VHPFGISCELSTSHGLHATGVSPSFGFTSVAYMW